MEVRSTRAWEMDEPQKPVLRPLLTLLSDIYSALFERDPWGLYFRPSS
jgi:hypothetical protein